ncbi:MAG: branched-chain amino acid ABC transporter permease [Firmicutes bacterium]|nr:branched-chain amino acid ABC transporter permease [Bacillota bacterium]MCL5039905.1 branched-chain amino acid ABC transporter permease [Bacillota bacterium]
MILQQLVNGLIIGSVYALIALGLTMIYGVLRILHVAHAGIYALGAYAGLVAYGLSQSFLLALLAAMVVAGAAGFGIQRYIYRPLFGTSPLVPLIASIGLFIFMEDLYRLVFGPNIIPLNAVWPSFALEWRGVKVTETQLVILLVTGLLLAFVWFFTEKTRLGLAWKAVAQDLEIAQAMGVNANLAVASNVVLGSVLAAAAGLLVAANYNEVYPTMGSVPAYKMLAIVVLGGLGNPVGTVLAGLLIGLVETLVVAYLGYKLPRDAIAFLALILVLMLKPQGLFARKGGG